MEFDSENPLRSVALAGCKPVSSSFSFTPANEMCIIERLTAAQIRKTTYRMEYALDTS
jgi:hypothetical protein